MLLLLFQSFLLCNGRKQNNAAWRTVILDVQDAKAWRPHFLWVTYFSADSVLFYYFPPKQEERDIFDQSKRENCDVKRGPNGRATTHV